MYTTPDYRGKGVASQILQRLEEWVRELGKRCILETGHKQKDAVHLYHKNNFIPIPNYGPYKNATSSICFEKQLAQKK